MLNKKELSYHNIFNFLECMRGYKEELPECHVILPDVFGKEHSYHGDKSHYMQQEMKELVLEVLPQAHIEIHLENSWVKAREKVEKLRALGHVCIVSMSMSTGNYSEDMNKMVELGAITVASNGNYSKDEEDINDAYRFPAAQNDWIGVAAYDIDGMTDEAEREYYSQKNNHTAVAGLTNQNVDIISADGVRVRGLYGGTSCACQDIGRLLIPISFWHYIVTGTKLTDDYADKYLINSCKDVSDLGYDPESGWGIPIMWDELHWVAPYKKYLDLKGMVNLKLDNELHAKRGEVFVEIASLLGFEVYRYSALKAKKAFDFLNSEGYFKIFEQNFDENITKGDLIILLTRYLLMNEPDTDKDGIADIIDIEDVNWGNQAELMAYYLAHVTALESILDIPIYDTTNLLEPVENDEALTMIARAFDYKEKYEFIDN